MNISSLNEALINNLIQDNTSGSKEKYDLFIKTLLESEYLMNEFKLYNNISNFKPKDKNDLISYINENIEVIKSFDPKTVKKEKDKFKTVFKEELEKITSSKSMDSSINSIINEKLKSKTKYDVNVVYESFDNIFQVLTTKLKPKSPSLSEEKVTKEELDLILKKASTILKEKYSDLLSEEEKKALRVFNNGSYDELKSLFEEWKGKALNEIECEKENIENDLYEASIERINSLPIDKDKIEESLISLSEILF